jgi:hypothetical protein
MAPYYNGSLFGVGAELGLAPTITGRLSLLVWFPIFGDLFYNGQVFNVGLVYYMAANKKGGTLAQGVPQAYITPPFGFLWRSGCPAHSPVNHQEHSLCV